MISIKNVWFHYQKDKEILKDISFDIKEDECVIILGPNGVGKSTLISLILGANKLQKGEIKFDGINIKDLNPIQKANHLAYVPQLIEGNNLTVKDTVLLGRLPFYKIYPSKEDFRKVAEIIQRFDLLDLIDKQTNEISGGERQKASIARGFVQESKLIIFDEPTSNLDIKAQLDVLSLIKGEKANKSFLISMHDINQALLIGDRFIFLKEGSIKYIVNKDEITEELLNDVYGVKSKIINDEKGKHIIYEN